jgi:hypothetical protein
MTMSLTDPLKIADWLLARAGSLKGAEPYKKTISDAKGMLLTPSATGPTAVSLASAMKTQGDALRSGNPAPEVKIESGASAASGSAAATALAAAAAPAASAAPGAKAVTAAASGAVVDEGDGANFGSGRRSRKARHSTPKRKKLSRKRSVKRK